MWDFFYTLNKCTSIKGWLFLLKILLWYYLEFFKNSLEDEGHILTKVPTIMKGTVYAAMNKQMSCLPRVCFRPVPSVLPCSQNMHVKFIDNFKLSTGVSVNFVSGCALPLTGNKSWVYCGTWQKVNWDCFGLDQMHSQASCGSRFRCSQAHKLNCSILIVLAPVTGGCRRPLTYKQNFDPGLQLN